MAAAIEEEMAWAQRAYPKAQELLAATPVDRVPNAVETGWHDTGTHPMTGCIALVRIGGQLEDLVGDILRVTYGGASSFVLVVGARDIVPELSLARRAFLALQSLAAESIRTIVEVCE